MPQGKRAFNYLTKERGIFDSTVSRHLLGTSVSLFKLNKHLRLKGFNEKEIIDSKLLKMKQDSYELRDIFYGFVIFPIISYGDIVNFTSRHIGNNGSMRHKHLEGTHKAPFNSDIIRNSDYLIITESPIDCLTLSQSGFPSIACFGTNNFKTSFISDLKPGAELYILFDNDKTLQGLYSSLEVGWQIFKDKNIVPKIAKLPQGGDINEMWMIDKKDFKGKIENSLKKAVNYTDYKHATRKMREDRNVRTWKNPVKKEEVEAIRKIPIYDIISDFIKLEEVSNKSWRGFCSFHNDKKSPSLFVYKNSNLYVCFGGCRNKKGKKYGDAISFIEKIKNYGFYEAINFINRNYLKYGKRN